MKKRVLFIDRDGTIVKEDSKEYRIDSFDKLEFYPEAFEYMRKIAQLGYELVMVTNQDGLGRDEFPEEKFWPVHNFILKAFENEGVKFNKVLIDKTYPHENVPTRKPGTGLLTEYIGNKAYNIKKSFVIGDRITDMQLAKNLGCKGIWLNNDEELGLSEINDTIEDLRKGTIVLSTGSWKKIFKFLKNKDK